MGLKILSVLGARPNVMNVPAIYEAINETDSLRATKQFHAVLVKPGQHYDTNMSGLFFIEIWNSPNRNSVWVGLSFSVGR
jgi:UDP-N-acetylglucosamine 2-epimerase